MLRLLLIFFAMTSMAYAQQRRIDSLKSSLEKAATPEEKISLLRTIGFTFFDAQVYYDSAYYYARKGYNLAKENEFVLQQAQTLFDLAWIHASLEEYDKALEFYQQSSEFSKKGDIKRGLSSAYNNIGAIYVELKQYTPAKKYYRLSLDLAEEIADQESIAVAHLNLGEISFFEGDLETSKSKIELSQQIFDSLGYTPPSAYTFLAKTYKDLGNLEIAEQQAIQGSLLAKKEGDLKYIYDNAITLSAIYEQQKDFEKANTYSKEAMLYNDSIISSKKMNEVEKVELRFKLNDQETKLARLEEKNKYLNTIYILAAIGVLLLIILVFRQLKIVRMTKNIHNIQNRLIKSELDIRDQKNATGFDAAIASDKENTETQL